MKSIILPKWLYDLNSITEKYDAPLYVVGGFLRDRIMGIPSFDIDLAGPAGLKLLEICADENSKIKIKPESIKLGTLKIIYDGHSCEYTCFRKDNYTKDGSHTPKSVILGANILEDALRRDFTMNALYYNISQDKLLDLSSGLMDIQNKTIRTIREPIEVFKEDALRILRLVRQSAQLGCKIDTKTLNGAKDCVHLLNNLAPERIQTELNLLLTADLKTGANNAVYNGLKLCEDIGILKILLPELQECKNIAQIKEYHDYDVLDHLFHSCPASKSDIISRLSALFHDVGKPIVAKDGKMLGHDKISAVMTNGILTRLKYPKKVINTVCMLINAHMYDLDGNTKTKRFRRFIAEFGYDNMEYLIDLRRADFIGSKSEMLGFDPANKWVNIMKDMKNQNVPDSVNEININGDELKKILGDNATIEIGRMKTALWLYVINHPDCNTKEKLLAHANAMHKDEKSWNKERQQKWIL